MDGRAEQPADFASAFEAGFARLQVQLETACAAEGDWPQRVVVAIRRGVEFAVADPDAASLLVDSPLIQGADGVARYERLMGYLASLLEGGRAISSHGAELPPTTERSLVGGVATIVANRIGRARTGELTALVPELVQFVLTPYLGTEEARKIAAAGQPETQRER